MVTLTNHKFLVLSALMLLVGASLCLPSRAAESGEESRGETGSNETAFAIRAVGLGLAAALVLGLTGLATAKVQAAVGAGGTGAIAEKPELFINIFVLYAIPETILVLGFVIAYLLLSRI